MLYDELEEFLECWLRQVNTVGRVPVALDVIGQCEGITSLVLFRNPPFQVQMFIVQPDVVIPEHTHPNVDSFEVYVGGDIMFTLNGEYVSNPEQVALGNERGNVVRVRPNDRHGGVFGKAGGAFLSVQMWKNEVTPTCVGNDYNGKTMGPKHHAKVSTGEPIATNGDIVEADALGTS